MQYQGHIASSREAVVFRVRALSDRPDLERFSCLSGQILPSEHGASNAEVMREFEIAKRIQIDMARNSYKDRRDDIAATQFGELATIPNIVNLENGRLRRSGTPSRRQ